MPISTEPLREPAPSNAFLNAYGSEPLPRTLPSNLYEQNGQIVRGNILNALARFFIPTFASSQDAKVSEFFMRYLKNYIRAEPSSRDRENVRSMLLLAEQHIAHGKGWFSGQTQDTCRLEHYTLLVRERLKEFDPKASKDLLEKKCRIDNKDELAKWTKLGFAEEAFWSSPDLVDFIFKSYLHRSIKHPYYKHNIEMYPVLVYFAGEQSVQLQPHILMDKRWTPWMEVCGRFNVDSESRIYTIENNVKKIWTYLEQGLTQWNKNNFDTPRPLRQLDQPPSGSRIEIITTHAHRKDWNLCDRFLKGTRHSFFRIVPGVGFAGRHPETGLKDGAVYSFGWGTRWQDFSLFGSLSTMQGKWFCPDSFEFFKEDLRITPLAVNECQAIKLLEIVKRRAKEPNPFHFITANCSGITAEILKEAGIIDLTKKEHMLTMWYEFLVPKAVRRPIDKATSFIKLWTPSFISSGIDRLAKFLHSLVFLPLFSLLGAWRRKISYQDEEGGALLTGTDLGCGRKTGSKLFTPMCLIFLIRARWNST